MHIRDILKKPIITERSNELLAENKYTFDVETSANKVQIKKAVEEIFGVKVEKVTTMNIPPKKRRVGKHEGYRPARKKAIVKVAEGQKIEIFEM